MKVKISVVLIGSELLDGRVSDKNASYLARRINELGAQMMSFQTCDDILPDIQEAVKLAANKSDFVVISGGLGPTSDDLTREALAALTSSKLELNQDILSALKARYESRGRTLDPSNVKQATFPVGSEVIPNPVGTAAGLAVKFEGVTCVALPGVPIEFQAMCEEWVFHRLATEFKERLKESERVSFLCFGIPEATAGSKIDSLGLPDSIEVSYRAHFPEVHICLKATESGLGIEPYARSAREVLGEEFIFSESQNSSLTEATHSLLLKSGKSFAAAESCTGGMVGELITRYPGSSSYFLGSAVTYSNLAKQSILGVTTESLENFGAVSPQVAREMAAGARNVFASDMAVALTGVAGPDGGTDAKPVGTVFIGVATEDDLYAVRFFFPAERAAVRKFASFVALDLIRRTLLELPINFEQLYE